MHSCVVPVFASFFCNHTPTLSLSLSLSLYPHSLVSSDLAVLLAPLPQLKIPDYFCKYCGSPHDPFRFEVLEEECGRRRGHAEVSSYCPTAQAVDITKIVNPPIHTLSAPEPNPPRLSAQASVEAAFDRELCTATPRRCRVLPMRITSWAGAVMPRVCAGVASLCVRML
jgi:hypothetical protein